MTPLIVFTPFIFLAAFLCRVGHWVLRLLLCIAAAIEWLALLCETGRLMSVGMLADAMEVCRGRPPFMLRNDEFRRAVGLAPLEAGDD